MGVNCLDKREGNETSKVEISLSQPRGRSSQRPRGLRSRDRLKGLRAPERKQIGQTSPRNLGSQGKEQNYGKEKKLRDFSGRFVEIREVRKLRKLSTQDQYDVQSQWGVQTSPSTRKEQLGNILTKKKSIKGNRRSCRQDPHAISKQTLQKREILRLKEVNWEGKSKRNFGDVHPTVTGSV